MMAVVFGLIAVPSVPRADAAETVTAEGVALAASADCQDASLDLTYSSGDIKSEGGEATLLRNHVVTSFSRPSEDLDFGDHATFEGFEISLESPQPDGTLIGTWAVLGPETLSETGSAVFFILYRCSADGSANEVITTCVGDPEACPRQADAANRPMLHAPDGAAVGEPVRVTGTGCYDGGGGKFVVIEPAAGGEYLLVGEYEAPDASFDFTFAMPQAEVGAELALLSNCKSGITAGYAPLVVFESAEVQPAAVPASPAVAAPAFSG